MNNGADHFKVRQFVGPCVVRDEQTKKHVGTSFFGNVPTCFFMNAFLEYPMQFD